MVTIHILAASVRRVGWGRTCEVLTLSSRENGVGTSIAAATTDDVTESRANFIAGNVMLGCYLVAVAAVVLYLVVILIPDDWRL